MGSDNMYLMCMASLKPPKADLKALIVKKGSMHLVLFLRHCEDLLLGPKLHKRGITIGGICIHALVLDDAQRPLYHIGGQQYYKWHISWGPS